ncbi:MAG: hypothetical protein AAF310_03420 [Myxococcota bacterium]
MMQGNVQKDLSGRHKSILIVLLYLFSAVLVLIIFNLSLWFDRCVDAQMQQKTQLSAASELSRYRQQMQQILSGETSLLPEGGSISIDKAITLYVARHRQ